MFTVVPVVGQHTKPQAKIKKTPLEYGKGGKGII